MSIEPVIGWRAWGLRLDDDGEVELVSPIQSFVWPPREPSRARCGTHFGKQLPCQSCTCGLYAVTRLDRLPAAGGLASSAPVAVVGSVAMWGRVVEHANGYRGQLAYPDRIRLVCRHCLRAGPKGVPTRIERTFMEDLEPVCDTHATNRLSFGDEITAERLQQMVLDAYAVDLLPIEALHQAGFWPSLVTPAGIGAAARHESRELARGRGAVLAVALCVAAYLVLRAVGFFGGVASPPATAPIDDATVEAENPVAAPVEAPRADLPHRRSSGQRPGPRFGVVCGHRIGDAVQMLPCKHPMAGLLGFWSSPPDRRQACGPRAAFTWRATFSVCWLDLDSGAEWETLAMPGVHRWELPSCTGLLEPWSWSP